MEKTATEQALALREEKALTREQQAMERYQAMTSLDWRQLPPPLLAQLIKNRPVGGRDGVDQYLTYDQAMFFAVEAYRMGVSPTSQECWFDTKTWRVNVTVEGQRVLASKRGDVGVPVKTYVERDWPEYLARITQFKRDIGCKCVIPVGDTQSEATAFLSEWYIGSNPNWKNRPLHMLGVRAEGLAYENITGVGVSQKHEDKDIEAAAKQSEKDQPKIVVVDTVESSFKPMNTEKEK